MKKQYKIVKHTTNGNLYYNEDFNIFTERFGTVYSSKRKATENYSMQENTQVAII